VVEDRGFEREEGECGMAESCGSDDAETGLRVSNTGTTGESGHGGNGDYRKADAGQGASTGNNESSTRAVQNTGNATELAEDLGRVIQGWGLLTDAAKSEILGVIKEAEELMKGQSSA